MITGGWGLAFNILTIVILSASFIVLLASLYFGKLETIFLRFDAPSRSLLLWCVVTIPWLVSIASVVVLVFPELFGWNNFLFSSYLHWHHINTFFVMSWHGASLLSFSIFFLLIFFKRLAFAMLISSKINQIEDILKPKMSPGGCFIIESTSIVAFASGLLRPRAYVSSGLYEKLNSKEIFIVEQHELAHANGYHPIKKYLFSVCASFFPTKLSGKLSGLYALALEQRADTSVLRYETDVSLIARTILRVTRLQGVPSPDDDSERIGCGFTTHPTELRIRYLLDSNKGLEFPYFVVFICTITIAIFNILSVDYIHHSFELLFSH